MVNSYQSSMSVVSAQLVKEVVGLLPKSLAVLVVALPASPGEPPSFWMAGHGWPTACLISFLRSSSKIGSPRGLVCKSWLSSSNTP